MTWLAHYTEAGDARWQAEKALSLPLGMASPLWLAFGAAASVGVAWWWMTRWTRPTNLEAAYAPARVETPPVDPTPEPVLEAEGMATLETAMHAAPPPEAVIEPVLAPAPIVAEQPADDLTRLVGIGPRIAEALVARGVTRFAHLAAWSAKELAAFDAELSLKGRGARDAWIAQAKRLAAEL